MKKLLVLAGGSQRNQVWGEACAEACRDEFDMTFFIHYDHWAEGEKNINFETELEKIAATVEGTGEESEWYIFAKSIGSILTLKAVGEKVIEPSKCVFFGMPLNLVADSMLEPDWKLLSDFSIPSIEFHNDSDPTADYAFTTEKLDEYAKSIKIETLAGDNHDYLDFDSYKEKINNFLHA